MNPIAIAKESIRITHDRSYEKNGRVITLPHADYETAQVYTPEEGKALTAALQPAGDVQACRITVTREGSFEAAARFQHPMVLNFANAHHAGGGFLLGANAQEEALCRCSTLYASISSDAAKEMYHYNNTHLSAVESDYMLLSDPVCVFRSGDCTLLDEPFSCAVITAPAPNRRGAALLASSQTVRETFLRRIRIMLAIAAKHEYRALILGAWGCGAFGNSPDTVAEAYRQVLLDEKYAACFSDVCFAVLSRGESKNYTRFRDILTPGAAKE